MTSTKFSYIFDEDLPRVFHCFTDSTIIVDIAYKDFVSRFNFIEGNNIPSEKTIFSFEWKEYYLVKMISEKSTDSEYYKSFSLRTTNIDKLPTEVTLIYNFYWDSVECKTCFIFEFIYKDEFFTDLFKVELNTEDLNKICKNIEKYLNSICKGLEIYHSCIINSSLESIWKYVGNPKIFFETISQEIVVESNVNELTFENLDSYLILSINSKLPNNKPLKLIKYIIDTIEFTQSNAKISLIAEKSYALPKQKFSLILKKLNSKKCFFSIMVKPSEYINTEVRQNFQKYWKKKIHEFKNFFEHKKNIIP